MSKTKRSKTNELISAPVVISEYEIAERAYALYLARGAEDGHDLADWLQAEQQLRRETLVVNMNSKTSGELHRVHKRSRSAPRREKGSRKNASIQAW